MVRNRSLLAATALLGLVGCFHAKITRTGPKYPPREEGCSIEMFTALPGSSFVEIGTIDLEGIDITDLAFLKKKISPKVCEAGGDAALAFTNGRGAYFKAAVLKRVAPPNAEVASPPTALSPVGCQHDMQCKGDRICVKGECVAPTPSSAPSSAPSS